MKNTEPLFDELNTKYKVVRHNLDTKDYADFETFYTDNDIQSEEEYVQILRAAINRPIVFIKRQPGEKWHNLFNPFLFNILKSNMD